MQIYLIENDGFRYQELDLHINDFIEEFPDDMDTLTIHDFSKHNLALAKYWPDMRTGFSQIEGGENLVPDVTCWVGATLLLSPRAYRLLADLLRPFGELLPLWIEKDLYYIFNCLTVCDAEGDDSYQFKFVSSSVGGKALFKPPMDFDCSLFCLEQFKNAVEDFELKGVLFSNIDCIEN